MAFRVVIGPAAMTDLRETTRRILRDSGPERAQRWQQGALAAIRGLADSPQSFGTIPEAAALNREYRQIHYHSHRIVFDVDEAAQVIVVARVYHGARRTLRRSDLP